jgi:serine/threonine protein phosphatase PrpC
MVGATQLINVTQAGYSDIGQVRKENEDFLVSYQSPNNDFVFTVVADGMGGYTGGAVASKIAANTVSEQLQAALTSVSTTSSVGVFEQIKQHLEYAINQSNRRVLDFKLTRPELAGMGTTLVVAIIFGQHLLVANVGDSRAYMYTDSKLHQISKDHSIIQELIDSGAVSAEMARNDSKRNQLTQAVGVAEDFLINFAQFSLQRAGLLLLCSDGLTEYLDLNSIEAELSRGLPASQSCHRLIETANHLGGKDNITVAIVEYGGY